MLVLERADRPGGAAVSEELTEPGFVHDVFSMNHNLFLWPVGAAGLIALLNLYPNMLPRRCSAPSIAFDLRLRSGRRPQ